MQKCLLIYPQYIVSNGWVYLYRENAGKDFKFWRTFFFLKLKYFTLLFDLVDLKWLKWLMWLFLLMKDVCRNGMSRSIPYLINQQMSHGQSIYIVFTYGWILLRHIGKPYSIITMKALTNCVSHWLLLCVILTRQDFNGWRNV